MFLGASAGGPVEMYLEVEQVTATTWRSGGEG